MRHRGRPVRSKGLLSQLAEKVLGRGQTLIAAGGSLPLIVAVYPRGKSRFAAALGEALRFSLPSLPPPLREAYEDILAEIPPVVVADLRSRNACECLGHHHPQSALAVARELEQQSGRRVGEIDLAVEAIRSWEPTPLSSLAVPPADRDEKARLDEMRFHTALLSVFLHELEHLAHPDRPESEVRRRSDRFYRDSIRARLRSEWGASFGLTVETA